MVERLDLGPFRARGNWYRGCLHAHTTASDGVMPPPQLVRHYADGAFDFLAITDHEKLTDPGPVRADILTIPGTELAVGAGELGEPYHVVGIGITAMPERRPGLSVQEAVDAIERLGGVAIIAHPYWSRLTAADLLAIDGYLAIEIYNTGCEIDIARGFSLVHWDELLSRGRHVLGVASDDTHYTGYDSLGAWTVVRAPELTADAIIAALRAGHFYASTGPAIHDVAIEGNVVHVACSPAARISVLSEGRRGAAAGVRGSGYPIRWCRPRGKPYVEGALLEEATFELTGAERLIRIQVTDTRGHAAWTNPIWLV